MLYYKINMTIDNIYNSMITQVGGAKKRSSKKKSSKKRSMKKTPSVPASSVEVGKKRKGKYGKMYESRRTIDGTAYWKVCAGKCSGGKRTHAYGPLTQEETEGSSELEWTGAGKRSAKKSHKKRSAKKSAKKSHKKRSAKKSAKKSHKKRSAKKSAKKSAQEKKPQEKKPQEKKPQEKKL